MSCQRPSSPGLLRALHLSVPGPLSASGGLKTRIPQHLSLSPLWADATPALVRAPWPTAPKPATASAAHCGWRRDGLSPTTPLALSLERGLPSWRRGRSPPLITSCLSIASTFSFFEPAEPKLSSRGKSQGPQKTRCFQTLRPRPWERLAERTTNTSVSLRVSGLANLCLWRKGRK